MEQTLDQKMEELTQIYELVDDVYDGYAASFGITDAELWVLYALSRHNGDYLQTDICRRWYYSLQTIHTTIKNMEKKGLITLLCQPGNRKNKYLHLTEAGKRLTARIVEPLMLAEKACLFRADRGGAGPPAAPAAKARPGAANGGGKAPPLRCFGKCRKSARPSGGQRKRNALTPAANRTGATHRNFKPNGKRPDCPPGFPV